MKNKLVINIIIAYFVVLCIVLFIQLNDDEDNAEIQNYTVHTESVRTDKMKDSVVMRVGSSSVFLNDKVFSIDPEDEMIVPKMLHNMVFVPDKAFSNVFKGETSWDSDKEEFVVRYNNKAVILNKDKMKIVDNINEDEKTVQNGAEIIDGNVYAPVREISEAFDKNVFSDGNVIIISDKDVVFKSKEDEELIKNLLEKLKLRNVLAFKNGSGLVYFNSQVVPIDENNNKITPVSENGKNYIPVKMISSVLGGTVSWNSDLKETTINYNGREAVFSGVNNKVSLSYNGKESEVIKPDAFKIINEYSYLSLNDFSEIFGKNVFTDGEVIIVSGKDNLFEKNKDSDIITEIKKNL